MKKSYIQPTVKVIKIELDLLLTASEPETVTIKKDETVDDYEELE